MYNSSTTILPWLSAEYADITYANCLEQSQWNNIRLSHIFAEFTLYGVKACADRLKSKDTLDFHEVRWIGGFSPQLGDAYISTHNTANYFCTSGSLSAANKKKGVGGGSLHLGKKHWGGLREFFKALMKLNERRKWERGKTQLLSYNAPLRCLFSCSTKQGHIFSAEDNERPMALKRGTQTTYMEEILQHQLQYFFVFCFLFTEQRRQMSYN